jgi:hypothetical protein
MGLLGRGALALAAAAVPDLALLSWCLALWVTPRLVGLNLLNDVFLMLPLEFFSVHAAGVLALMLTAERERFGRARAAVLGAYLAGITALLVWTCPRLGLWWPLGRLLGARGRPARRVVEGARRGRAPRGGAFLGAVARLLRRGRPCDDLRAGASAGLDARSRGGGGSGGRRPVEHGAAARPGLRSPFTSGCRPSFAA